MSYETVNALDRHSEGGFLAFSNLNRKSWELKGPFSKGIEVNHIKHPPRRNDDGFA